MNKADFIKELEKKTGLDAEKGVIVNGILEDNFIIGEKHRKKIITAIAEQLGVANAEAERIYEAAMSVVGSGLGEKLKHPFGE